MGSILRAEIDCIIIVVHSKQCHVLQSLAHVCHVKVHIGWITLDILSSSDWL